MAHEMTSYPRRFKMLEPFFFILGLVNSVLLIVVFLIRRNRLDILQRIGWMYLLLAIPAAYGIFLVVREQKAIQYGVFLGIFLGFLVLEWLYDFVLNLSFRENWGKNWKWLVPYLGFYYAMNYGFVVMPWKASTAWGIIMAGLFAIQIIVNLRTHPSRMTSKR